MWGVMTPPERTHTRMREHVMSTKAEQSWNQTHNLCAKRRLYIQAWTVLVFILTGPCVRKWFGRRVAEALITRMKVVEKSTRSQLFKYGAPVLKPPAVYSYSRFPVVLLLQKHSWLL